MNQSFYFAADLEKSEITDDGRYIVYGCASSTSKDKDNDVITLNALNKMAKSAPGKPITRSHNNELLDRFGKIVSAEVDGNKLLIKGELNPKSSDAMTLFDAIQAGEKCGFSVGGKITKYSRPMLDKSTRLVIDDVDFDHVMATSKPKNDDTFAMALAKAEDAIVKADTSTNEGELQMQTVEPTLEKAGAKLSADTKASLKDIHDAGNDDTKAKVRALLGDDANDVLGSADAGNTGVADDAKAEVPAKADDANANIAPASSTDLSESIGLINKAMDAKLDLLKAHFETLVAGLNKVEPKGEVVIEKSVTTNPYEAYLTKSLESHLAD